MAIPATLIPGDGIGPEITDAVVTILDALGTPFAWDRHEGGVAAVKANGDPLPPALLESIRRTRLALKGPLATPVGGGFRSVNVRLREEFGLYANLRPVRTMVPGGRYEDIDMLLAAGLMLEHVGRADLAARLRKAIDATLRDDGVRTTDLGGKAKTKEFAQAIVRRIG